MQHTPKRCRHRRAQAKDGARPGAGNIICTGQNTQSRKQDEQRRSRSTANAAALTGSTRSTSPLPVYSDRVDSAVTRHRCSSAEPRPGMTIHGATRNASERASSAGPVGGPCRHTTDAVCRPASQQPTSVPRRPHSCPAKHNSVPHHDAYAACNVGTAAPTQPQPVLASESTNEAHLDVPEAAVWSTRGRVGQAHEPPRLPPPRLRTPAGARTVDRDVAESDMILGSAAPRAVRGPRRKHRRSRLRKVYKPGPIFSARSNSKSASPGRSASGSPWSSHSPPRMARLRSPAEPSRISYPAAEDMSPVLGSPERTGTAAAIDLSPRKPSLRILKAGIGNTVWKASRSARSRDRARAQRASSRRQLAHARAAAATPSCTPRRSSRRASGSKRRRSSHATKARLPGAHTLASHSYACMHACPTSILQFCTCQTFSCAVLAGPADLLHRCWVLQTPRPALAMPYVLV